LEFSEETAFGGVRVIPIYGLNKCIMVVSYRL